MEQEEDLVRRAQEGDRTAFEELMRRTSRLVYSRFNLEPNDPHQSEDLAQETYCRAFRSIRHLKDPSRFRGWVLSIAQSVAVDTRRRAPRQMERTPRTILENLPAPPAQDPGLRDRREKIRSVLQSLPEEYRLPLTLRYLAGADYETITMQLGLGAGALRGLLYRGLQLLRHAVKSEVFHEPR